MLTYFSKRVGSEIASLSMGGNNINPVSIVHDLKEFVINTKRKLCPPDSLRQITVVAVVKVLDIRLVHEDRWALAHLGTVAVREPTSKIYQKRKIHGFSREFYAVEVPAHIFTPIESIGSFFHAVNGMREALAKLVHPSIMCGESLMRLLYKIVSVYEHHDGGAEIQLLMKELCTRVAEHATSVRK